jgi:hypothetical protein
LSDPVSVSARLVGMERGRPPQSQLILDVILRNETLQARWFLVPAVVPPAPDGGVAAVEVSLWHGKGRVVVGHFLGRGGVHALALPPGAEVRVRELRVSSWTEPAMPLQLHVVIGKRVRIGGDDISAWFPVDPACDQMADALAAVDLIFTRHTPDHREVPIVTEVDQELRVEVLPDLC